MTKMSGVPSAFYTAQYDLSGDIGALGSLSITRAVGDVTGLAVAGTERATLRADAEISYTGWWNPAAAAGVPVLRDLSGSDIVTTYAAGLTIGCKAASLVGNRASFAAQRGADGSLVTSGQVQASGGHPLEWGRLLTTPGKQPFASAASGTYIDRGVGSASNYGLAAYLHAFALTSGTAVVTVQDSADHSAWDAVIAFTAVTGATSERKQTSLTENVRRYLRIDVSGTFTGLVLAVNAVPYRIAQV